MKRLVNLKKALILLITILPIISVIFHIGCSKKSPEVETIKIGAVLPLTGDGAAYGIKEKNGVELAIQKANASGGINGKSIEIVYEDSQGTPVSAVSAIRKLINLEKIQVVIGGAFSSPTLAMVPIANQNNVVLMSPSASSPKLSGSSPYFFRVWPSDTSEGSKMAEIAVNELKLGRFAVISGNNDYSLGLKDVFAKKIIAMNKKVVSVETYNEGDSDFRAQLTKIKEKSPDAIYMVGYYAEFAKILRQAKELGINVQFLSCGTFHEPEILNLAGNAAEGVVFVQPYFNRNGSDPLTREFVDAYEKQFNIEAGVYAAHGYDAAHAIIEAMKDDNVSSIDLQKSLVDIKEFSGVTGKISFVEGGDVIKTSRVMVVKNGTFVDFKK